MLQWTRTGTQVSVDEKETNPSHFPLIHKSIRTSRKETIITLESNERGDKGEE